ncbi:transglycosylase SLT domain-containing protein [uncultured Roseobacter sp.]|uniref:transglycosylase SLT domain-containing protein n=1 Tax=uncultured Roseobacter sp. TaxID=114847 RepID=UPI0026124915|nr:transglycosylase SLT domain-containing protein [uncultured Roseobacter sp.]
MTRGIWFLSWVWSVGSAVLVVIIISGYPVKASGTNTCDRAATLVAQETNVPLSILRAITRTETGRTRSGHFEPWPWATNTGGEGRWFDTKSEAIQHAQARLNKGTTNIDIGCFQLNYRWHGHAFSNLEHMFDPVENARYAAGFLSKLYAEKKDWIGAVGAYHSRTQENASRYKRRFSEVHAQLADSIARPSYGSAPASRSNRFPLLQRSNTQPSLGSLVPLGQTTGTSILLPPIGEI